MDVGRRRWLVLVAALISIVAPLCVIGSSASADSDSWIDWLSQSITAAQGVQALGPNVTASDLSAVDRSTLALADGSSVEIDQRTALVSDGTTTVLLGMTVLGEQQLIVDVISPSSGDASTLVLTPGGTGVDENIKVRHGHRSTPAGAVAPLVAGGCYASPDAPYVIGSAFGPLVKGIGVVSCPDGNESLSVIASLYERTSSGSTHVGNGGSASVFGTYLAVDAYAACSPSTGHQFQTAQLWSVKGTLQAGGVSGWATLNCR